MGGINGVEVEEREAVTIDGQSGTVDPPPHVPKIKLKKLEDIRREMARVYRQMRAGAMRKEDGTKLVYVLGELGKLMEREIIEGRLAVLEEALIAKKLLSR